MKQKRLAQQHEEKSQGLRDTLRTSVSPEEMNRHNQEVNFEIQTGEKCEETEMKEEQWSFMTDLKYHMVDIPERLVRIHRGKQIGRARET